MPEKLINIIDKLVSILIKAVIFFLPLFFLPLTSEYFEFNKQFLLWLIMPSVLFLWLIKQALEGKITVKTNPLNFPVIIFLALTAISAIFSVDAYSSWLGSYGRFSDAWLGLLSLAIFYWLLINAGVAESAKKITGLLRIFIYSAATATVISLLSIFGLTQSIMPVIFNPAGGSFLSLAIFLAVASVLAVGFIFSPIFKKFERVILGAGLILFLFVLTLINFYLSWIILALGAGLIIIFYFLEAGLSFKKILNYYSPQRRIWRGGLLIPALLMLAAILFLAFPGLSPSKIILGRSLPGEVMLDYKTSASVTKKAIYKNPILGSGPATFSYDFSLYRPPEYNKNSYWQIRFNESVSHFLEILATSGLLSTLSYFLIISLIIYINIILLVKYFKNREPVIENENYNLITTVFTIFILLFFSQLFFSANTVLIFSFWFFAALAVAFWQIYNKSIFKEKSFNLKKTALLYCLLSLILFLSACSWLILAFFEIKFFTAELAAASNLNREANLLRAVEFNPGRVNYNINLAKFYLNRLRVEAAKPEGEKDNDFIQLNITRSIEAGRQAVLAAPNSVKARETLGMIYRDIRPLTVGSEIWAVRFFESALALEPTNPILAAELAKAYVNNKDTALAEKYFIKAVELKPDYYEAKFDLAKVYLKNKKDNLALNLLNELAGEIYDAEIFYELGRFYFNHGETDKAIDRFKLALSVSSKHSNSLYSMAVAYEAKGDIKEALRYYNQVLELNPENKEIEKKIKDLEEKPR